MASNTGGFKPGLSLQIRIMLTSIIVFGLVTAIIGFILYATGMAGSGSIYVWMLVSLLMIGIQWYLGPAMIKWATGAKELTQVQAPELFEIVKRLTSKAGLPMPKLYIVDNPSPNAFAFGRTQSSSNIAIHSGILSVLSKEELEGVLAHEIGHINNRDVAVMTLASVLPVMLYYAVLIFAPRNRDSGYSIIDVFGAFVAQFIGQLLVMWLSRQREYYADEFSARLTKNPVSLMSALAKISYGQAVGTRQAEDKSMMKALYFAEPSGAKMSASEIASAIKSGNDAAISEAIEKEKRMGAIELLMSHPLTAKRLERLLAVKKEIAS